MTKIEEMNVYEYLTRFDQKMLLDIEEFGFFAFVDHIPEIHVDDIPYEEGVLRKAASRMWEFKEMARLCGPQNSKRFELVKNERKRARLEEFKDVCRFIENADIDELLGIVEEVRCCHDNLMAFNADTKLLAKVESVCQNGDSIQLNIERE